MTPKIIVLTDSLGLARKAPQSVLLEETWPCLLKSALATNELYQFSMGGATSTDLLEQGQYWMHGVRPVDWLIVQAGIVDCAPRAFSKRERVLQQVFSVLTRPFPKFSKFAFEYIRRSRQVSYVDAKSFRGNVEKLKHLADEQRAKLLWLPVLGAGFYNGILPGVDKKIAMTNEILQAELGDGFIDVKLGAECFMSDGHHLVAEGHRILADRIFNYITAGQNS